MLKEMRILAVTAVALAVLIANPARADEPLTLLVHPLIGTSTTPDGGDVIDDFPGADVPLGMLQWSPDTPSQNAGGGYEYNDKSITGLSMTHLSGPGCSVFGDFAVLPTTGAVAAPDTSSQPFSHADESATPGSYSVRMGDPAIAASVTVTKRSGLGQFIFPSGAQQNLLFKVASNQAGVRDAGFHVVSDREVAGYASSGGFCGMPDAYTVYFVARFDRPFAAFGTWHGAAVSSGSRAVTGADTGGYVSFDPSHPRVLMQVGLSFVDEAGARRNIDAERTGWNMQATSLRATHAWTTMLSRIAVSGGTSTDRTVFYTALYHALLHPNTISDADGRYRGFDNRIHRVRPGHMEYANFSDWDIYRTEIPLLALIAPHETSDMAQSLVDAASQDELLPRWALVNGATSVMGGDSVDAIIAGAYAFGARDFDTHAALAAMVKGASDLDAPPANGWYIERPELAEYLSRGYIVNTHTTSVSPVPNGASETLEYALDDFSIARFAAGLGDAREASTFMKRSANWSNLFNTATGWIAPRDASGAFMNTTIGSNGQSGFQEGNAAQYTWMVPQDLADLISGMGGRAQAVAKLDTFFTHLNVGEDKPYAWLGNEPTIGSPWVYLSAGAPWRTQSIIRQSLTTLYGITPQGLPGNDDLGTMSAWYVWSAIGLYPQNPSVRVLDIGSPLFPHIVVHSPNGPTIAIDAPQASDTTPYVQSLTLNGVATQHTWLALPTAGNTHLDFDVGDRPNLRWGSAPADAPPSFATVRATFPPSTAVSIACKACGVSLAPGRSATIAFALSNASATSENVTWSNGVAPPLHLDVQAPATIPARATISLNATISVDPSAQSGIYDAQVSGRTQSGAVLEAVHVPVNVVGSDHAQLAYVENRFDDSVTPFDPRTGALGANIAVGTEPRDAVLSSDGSRLYVADRGAKSISIVDTHMQKTVATVAVGNSPNGVLLSRDGSTVWVANYDDNTIQSVDTRTLQASKPIAVGINPRYIAAAPSNAYLLVTNTNDNTVSVVDLSSRAVVATVPVGMHPSGVAIAPDGRVALVTNFGSNDVTPIDLTTRTAGVPIPVGVEPVQVVMAPNGATAYVTNFATTTITPIDVAKRLAQPAIRVGGAPYAIAIARDGTTAYVIARRDNAIVPVDLATGTTRTPIVVGTSPYTLAFP